MPRGGCEPVSLPQWPLYGWPKTALWAGGGYRLSQTGRPGWGGLRRSAAEPTGGWGCEKELADSRLGHSPSREAGEVAQPLPAIPVSTDKRGLTRRREGHHAAVSQAKRESREISLLHFALCSRTARPATGFWSWQAGSSMPPPLRAPVCERDAASREKSCIGLGEGLGYRLGSGIQDCSGSVVGLGLLIGLGLGSDILRN